VQIDVEALAKVDHAAVKAIALALKNEPAQATFGKEVGVFLAKLAHRFEVL
jgi:hypothetical protein